MVLPWGCLSVGRVGGDKNHWQRIFNNGKNPALKNHSGRAVPRSVSDNTNEKLFISSCTWGKNYYLKKWVKGVRSRIEEEKSSRQTQSFSAPFLLAPVQQRPWGFEGKCLCPQICAWQSLHDGTQLKGIMRIINAQKIYYSYIIYSIKPTR